MSTISARAWPLIQGSQKNSHVLSKQFNSLFKLLFLVEKAPEDRSLVRAGFAHPKGFVLKVAPGNPLAPETI